VTSAGPKNKTICQTNVPKVDASQWVTYGEQTNRARQTETETETAGRSSASRANKEYGRESLMQ